MSRVTQMCSRKADHKLAHRGEVLLGEKVENLGAATSEHRSGARAHPPPEALLPAYLMAVAATALWGTQPPLIRVAVADASFLAVVAVRSVLTALILAAFLFARHGWTAFVLPRGDLLRMVALGIGGLMLAQTMLFFSLTRMTASAVAILYNTSPIFMALMAAVWIGERLRRVTVAGIVVSFAGVAVLVTRGGGPAGMLDLLGVGATLLGAIGWAGYTVGGRDLLTRYEPARVVTLTSIAGALGFIPLAALLEPAGAWQAPAWVWLIALYLAALPIGLGNILWYGALRMLPAARVGVFMYTVPIWTMLIAALWLREPITPALLAGAALVLCGLWLSQRR